MIGCALAQPVDGHGFQAVQGVIGVADGLVPRIGDLRHIPGCIILIAGGETMGIGHGGNPAHGVIVKSGDSQNILTLDQVVVLVVGVRLKKTGPIYLYLSFKSGCLS